ncbi:DAK2 domain-containing protein [Nocardia tengchongensis]|uniref:DAK2 domain-containing protein n=1 Tax=Nocardia tengchongensis TaxID=2055889 RepID=UPI0036B314BD
MPGVADALDGTALLNWGRHTLTALERHRDEINALNVFPVADSDTGTNLLSTMRAAVRGAEAAIDTPIPSVGAYGGRAADGESAAQGEALRLQVGATDMATPAAPDHGPAIADHRPLSTHGVMAAMARAATMGARGNSGIILSQVLRGVADSVAEGPLTAEALRFALRQAARLVREALSSPVEGTMLTILDRAAERAADASERDLLGVALAAADGAVKALGETPAQLGVLREAGVVDAGARGLLVLLDELVAAAGGSAPARPVYRRGAPEERPSRVPDRAATDVSVISEESAADRSDFGTDGSGGGVEYPSEVARSGEAASNPIALVPNPGAVLPTSAVRPAGELAPRSEWGSGAPHYEVMFLVRGSDQLRIGELRDQLGALGDSVVVVGDGDETWSAHVHCGDAGAAVEAGLAAGVLSGIRIEILDDSGHTPTGKADRAILAVASGTGAVRLFEDAGAVVLEGAVTADVLLEAIRRVPQREVLVLPNGALPAHELVAVSVAARDGQREVLMLPCGSMVQGLAALSMHDAGRAAADDAFAMSEAAAGTRWGALRVAPERSLTMVGMCEAGDGLGLVGHDVVVIDSDVRAAGRTLLDRMLGLGGELVTMLLGGDAPEGLSDDLTAHVAAGFPGVEVVVYPGGQAGDLVQIGVE